MKKTSVFFLVLFLAFPVISYAEEAPGVVHPEWGWIETSLFFGEFTGSTGALISTASFVLPVIMNIFCYSSAPTTWSGFWLKFGQTVAAKATDDPGILILDCICISTAIACDVVRRVYSKKKQGERKVSISVLGIEMGEI